MEMNSQIKELIVLYLYKICLLLDLTSFCSSPSLEVTVKD